MSSEKGIMIVGVDGSPASLRALEWASKNAVGLNCAIEVISTWEPYVPSGELVGSGVAPVLVLPILDTEQIAGEVIENCIKEVFGNARPEDLTSRTVMGDPGRVLVSESENATIVVVGSRGHGKFRDLVLGSVSSTCAAKAKCPVVVVHAS